MPRQMSQHKMINITVPLPEPLFDELGNYCKFLDATKGKVIRQAIQEYLAKQDKVFTALGESPRNPIDHPVSERKEALVRSLTERIVREMAEQGLDKEYDRLEALETKVLQTA